MAYVERYYFKNQQFYVIKLRISSESLLFKTELSIDSTYVYILLLQCIIYMYNSHVILFNDKCKIIDKFRKNKK